jgi:hypothetical protein
MMSASGEIDDASAGVQFSSQLGVLDFQHLDDSDESSASGRRG